VESDPKADDLIIKNEHLKTTQSARVMMDTAYGQIVAEIYTAAAPVTATNFLRYIDAGLYAEASFYRAARPDNDRRVPHISVLQGGIDETCRSAPFPPIPHESTRATGLTHCNGALSAVRWEPGTATSEFFIVVGDTPELDFGGARNPDGQGFAAFGRVILGMDVVRQIHAGRTGTTSTVEFLQNQSLIPPVGLSVERLATDSRENEPGLPRRR